MKWANKKQNNFNIYNVVFLLNRVKKNTCRYHYKNLDDMIYMIYISWDIQQNILKLVILGHLLPFYLHKKTQNQNFEKQKNLLEISSFYTCVPKITIILGTVLEIQSETNRILVILDLFLSFQLLDNPENQSFKIE